MNMKHFVILTVSFITSQSTSSYVNGSKEILPMQQSKEIETRLAEWFDLPKKRFDPHDRRERMARSENKFLLELYHKEHENKHKKAHRFLHKRTIRKSNYIITYGAKKYNQNNTNSQMILQFNLKGMPNIKRLIAAELRLNRNPIAQYLSNEYKILTYTLTKDGFVILNQDKWTVKDYGWLIISVSNLIANVNQDFINIYLSAKVHDWDADMIEDVGVSGTDGPISEKPFLVTYFDVDLRLKARSQIDHDSKYRNIRNRDKHSNPIETQVVPFECSLQIFDVDFQELDKFTSVVVPERYQANYCIGKCSFPLQGKASNHAIIQALYSSVKTHLELQCAPNELAPLDVIHWDHEENLVHKTYDDMIVKTCSCQ